LPFYLLAVWLLISVRGIEGAAIAWVLRMAVDTLILFGMVRHILPTSALIIRRMALFVGGALFVLVLFALPIGNAIKMPSLVLMLFTFVLVVWFLILSPKERALVQSKLPVLEVLFLGWKKKIKNKT